MEICASPWQWLASEHPQLSWQLYTVLDFNVNVGHQIHQDFVARIPESAMPNTKSLLRARRESGFCRIYRLKFWKTAACKAFRVVQLTNKCLDPQTEWTGLFARYSRDSTFKSQSSVQLWPYVVSCTLLQSTKLWQLSQPTESHMKMLFEWA